MIGGNVKLELLVKSTEENELGEQVVAYAPLKTITGWLDYTGGLANREWDATIENSTHIFLADYVALGVNDENMLKASVDGQEYIVQKIDDPMGLHRQLEIYLKQIGDGSDV